MPYKRRQKKRYRKNYNGGGRTLQSVGNLAQTAFKIARNVASLVNTEHKYNDNFISGINPSSITDSVNLLNGITQGIDNTQRIGRSVKGKYICYKGHAYWNAAATTNVAKIALVLDTKANGAIPAALDIFSVRTEMGHRNIDNGTRFKVLDQKCIELSANQPFKCFESYVSLEHLAENHTEYDGTTSGIADITAHPLYLVVMSSDVANLCTVQLNSRYRYIDN